MKKFRSTAPTAKQWEPKRTEKPQHQSEKRRLKWVICRMYSWIKALIPKTKDKTINQSLCPPRRTRTK